MIKYLIISIAEGEVVQVSGINQIYKNIMEESFPQIKKKTSLYTECQIDKLKTKQNDSNAVLGHW